MSSESSLPEHVPEPIKMIPYVAAPARSRTALACEKCRERKTKCSGEHPACKRCKTRGLVCVYGPRDSKGRYQSTFAVTKSQSTSSLRSSTPTADSGQPFASHSDVAERRSRSMEENTLPPSPYSLQDRAESLSSSQSPQSFQSQHFQTPSAQYHHERNWSHPSFSSQMSTTPFQSDFDHPMTRQHARLPTDPIPPSHLAALSQSMYPAAVDYTDVHGHRHGHRQGHHQQLSSMSSISSVSSGGSMPSTPTVMGYSSQHSVYKSDQAFSSEPSGTFVAAYNSGLSDPQFIPPTSYRMEGYQYTGEYAGHHDHLRTASHATNADVASQPQSSFMRGHQPTHSSSSSLDGALDPYHYSPSRTFF